MRRTLPSLALFACLPQALHAWEADEARRMEEEELLAALIDKPAEIATRTRLNADYVPGGYRGLLGVEPRSTEGKYVRNNPPADAGKQVRQTHEQPVRDELETVMGPTGLWVLLALHSPLGLTDSEYEPRLSVVPGSSRRSLPPTWRSAPNDPPMAGSTWLCSTWSTHPLR